MALVSVVRVAELMMGAITSASEKKKQPIYTHLLTDSFIHTLLSVHCLVEDLNWCLADGSSHSDLIWSKRTCRSCIP